MEVKVCAAPHRDRAETYASGKDQVTNATRGSPYGNKARWGQGRIGSGVRGPGAGVSGLGSGVSGFGSRVWAWEIGPRYWALVIGPWSFTASRGVAQGRAEDTENEGDTKSEAAGCGREAEGGQSSAAGQSLGGAGR